METLLSQERDWCGKWNLSVHPLHTSIMDKRFSPSCNRSDRQSRAGSNHDRHSVFHLDHSYCCLMDTPHESDHSVWTKYTQQSKWGTCNIGEAIGLKIQFFQTETRLSPERHWCWKMKPVSSSTWHTNHGQERKCAVEWHFLRVRETIKFAKRSHMNDHLANESVERTKKRSHSFARSMERNSLWKTLKALHEGRESM